MQGCRSRDGGAIVSPPTPPLLADPLSPFGPGGCADFSRHITTGPTRILNNAASLDYVVTLLSERNIIGNMR